MSQSDFVRRMGSGGSAIYCGPSQWRRLHVDIPLLSLLLVLAIAGLFVLYPDRGPA